VNATSGRRLLRAPGFIGLLATNFVLGLTSAFIAPFGSLWATQEIGMSARMLGLFMTINSLSAILVSTLVARWSDSHIARRNLLIAGACAGALGNLGYAFVREPLLLLAIGSSALAVASLCFAQLFAHVREELGRPEHDGADVPFLMGVLRACYALAWMIGPNLGAWLKGWLGYRGLFLATTSFFILLCGFILRFVARRPRSAAARPAESGLSAWGLRQPRFIVHCIAFGLMFAAFTLNGLNLPLFLTQTLGGTERSVGAAFAISPLFEMLFMVAFGHLAARGHQRGVILIGASASVCYFLALRFVTAPWQVYPLQVLNAAAVAVTVSVAIPFVQDLLPGQPGVATSLYSNALKAGSLLGFAAFGALAVSVGNAGLFPVCAGLAAATLTIVALARPRPLAEGGLPKKAPV
jgi:SET family sugar efflux transporter-like MFS transporter